jgi:uncharacterized protein YdeI (YjbR/CyaY-like superfamily)
MGLFDLERVEIKSRAGLRTWLQAHHSQTESVWLVTYKRSSPLYTAYGDIVEEALCFGWIDSRPAKLDETRSMLLLSPRRPGSAWSKLNKDRVARLAGAGMIAAPGQAKIDQAKRDGSWDALNAVDALEIPEDLSRKLRTTKGAQANFAAFPPSAKRGILEWIRAARTAATREKRVEETAILAAKNIRANTAAARDYLARSASTK